MGQQSFPRTAPAAFVITARFTPGEGWSLFAQVRYDGDQWDDRDRHTYARLSTEELIDVICAEAEGQLHSRSHS